MHAIPPTIAAPAAPRTPDSSIRHSARRPRSPALTRPATTAAAPAPAA